jgi:membrane-bound lytic murein transglycosylase MltF
MKYSPFNTKSIQLSGLSPLKIDDDYSHVPMDSLIARQQFNESRFKSDAVSEDGATSIAQIMPDTFKDGLKKGYVPKGTKYEDLANDDKIATQFQENYMSDLLTRSWNTGTDQVKRAKALAAYNMGPTGLVNHLNAQKEKGIDIYKSLNWLEGLNKETKDYVKNIMLGGNEDYEKEFNQEYKKKFGKIKDITPEQISGLSPL